MLTEYGKREWLTIIIVAIMLTASALWAGMYIVTTIVVIATPLILTFFRDPYRAISSDRNVVVCPADGTITGIIRLNHFEPFGEGAVCVRIFMSVLNVHVNRSPSHGVVSKIIYRPGKHRNALNPQSVNDNESNTIVFMHPTRGTPVAAVRQIAGLIARTIVCGIEEGAVLQRGERFGMIKFGSTTELYLPDSLRPQVLIEQGQKVFGGSTIIATVSPLADLQEQYLEQARQRQSQQTTNIQPAIPAIPDINVTPQP